MTASRNSAKLARFLLSLALICSLNFALPRMMPGSPVFTILGPDVVGLSSKDYARLEKELGLDQPLWKQFGAYLAKIAKGELGYSYYFHRPVSQVLMDHLGPTLLLLIPAVILSSFLAAILGALAGDRPGSGFDSALTFGFLFIFATPSFLAAMVALDIFAFRWDIFPLGGLASLKGDGWSLTDMARHLALPVMVLSLSSAAAKFLVMRNSVARMRSEDFVTYARARGFSRKRILFVHLMRNASLPLISLIGLNFAFILSGSLLVEIVFSINGMGSLIYEAAMNRDYPILQGCFFLLTLVVLAVNGLIDLLYGVLDPRVKA